MLKLSRELFDAKLAWIAPAGVAERRNCHFRARRKIDRKALNNGLLSIAAESFYAVYVNGRFVGKGPARGTYTCNFLDRYDISQYLCDNDNSIAVEVFCNNYPTFISSPAEPALFVQAGEVICDESWDVQIAPDWREDVPKYTLQIGSMEWRDMGLEPLGWTTFDDNSNWTPASVISPERPIYSKALYLRDVCHLKANHISPVCVPVTASVGQEFECEPDKLAEFISNEKFTDYSGRVDVSAILSGKPVEIKPLTKGVGVAIILDFGQAIIGELELDIDAAPGVILDVSYDEYIDGGKIIPARTHYKFADRYFLRDGRQVVSNPLHWRGGRYVQLIFRKLHNPVTINKITFTDFRYPLDSPAEFMCSDENMNLLWQKSLATMSACATDTFLDCPWREMSFWVNDFVVQQEFWQQLAGRQDLVQRSISLALSQPVADGLLPGVCPYDGNERLVLFPTNLFMAIILRDYQKYSGNEKYVSEVLGEIEKIFNICQQYADADGLLTPPLKYWNFTDWSYWLCNDFKHLKDGDETVDGKNVCITNWFNCLAAISLSELFKNRDSVKSAQYAGLARRIAAAIIKKFWNEDLNCFNEISEKPGAASKITHALGLLSGLLPEQLVAPCIKALYRDDCMTPELYMMHFIFKALAKSGNYSEIMKIIRKYWQPMVESDSPTIWEVNVYEHAKQAFWNAGSMCHAFALAPVSFMQQEILGIRPVDDGFKTFSVNPHSAGLKFAKGKIPTPRGFIEIAWEKRDKLLGVSLRVPDGETAISPCGLKFTAGHHTFELSENDL